MNKKLRNYIAAGLIAVPTLFGYFRKSGAEKLDGEKEIISVVYNQRGA